MPFFLGITSPTKNTLHTVLKNIELCLHPRETMQAIVNSTCRKYTLIQKLHDINKNFHWSYNTTGLYSVEIFDLSVSTIFLP